MAARLCSLKVFLILLNLQSFAAQVYKRSCFDSSDCSLDFSDKKCCNGVCTERANCDGSCTVDSNCDLSLDESCCRGHCKESRCYEKTDLVIGLSVAGGVVLFVLIGVGVCCAYRSRPAPGRIVNQRVIRTTNRTRRALGAPKQQYSRYQNTSWPNQGYEEFPQPPHYSSRGYQPSINRGDQQSPTGEYQPSGYGWQQPPPVGRFQPPTTTFSREAYQNNFNEGVANAGMGPPPPYIEAARGHNTKLYVPQQSYGTETSHTPPSATPS